MSTTPPPEQPTQTTPRSYGGGGVTVDVARLPIPGNAEFALYLVAVILAWIVTWTTESLPVVSEVDPVEARRDDRRRRHADVHLRRARVAQHRNELPHRRPPHDRV